MKSNRHIIIAAIVAIIVLFCAISCDTIKNKSTRERAEDRQEETASERITFRKGDSIVFVPRVRYRDTTIVRTNVQGTTIRTVYDREGNVKQFECYASTIQDILRENQKLVEKVLDSEKTKDKQVEFKTDWLIWFIVGFFVVLLIVILVIIRYFKGYVDRVVPK